MGACSCHQWLIVNFKRGKLEVHNTSEGVARVRDCLQATELQHFMASSAAVELPSVEPPAPLEDLLGTWIDSTRSVALIIKMSGSGLCEVEERRIVDGSLIASGELHTGSDSQGWRVWDRMNYGVSDLDFPERFRISDADHDLLEYQLLETWGDWDDCDEAFRRCFDEVILHKVSPAKTPSVADVEAHPVQLAHLSSEVALVGSGDGHVYLLESGSTLWSRHLHEWLPTRMNYGVNVEAFSPDGIPCFLGTTAGKRRALEPETGGYVICFGATGSELMWCWDAESLQNPSALDAKVLSVSPDGHSVAVGWNRIPFLGFDGMEFPLGDDYLVYLRMYGDGTRVEPVWIEPQNERVVALAHSPHSVYLAVCFGSKHLYRDEIACISTTSGQVIWQCPMPGQRLNRHNIAAGKIQFSPGGRFIACAAWGHSSEQNDDFPGSKVAEVDDDDVCTVTYIAIESGQVIWRSKPIQDCGVHSIQLTCSPDGRSLLVACELVGEDQQEETCKCAVVRLDARTGNPIRKATCSFPDTLRVLCLKECSDLQVAVAVDAWEGDATAAKVFRIGMCGPPADWIGHGGAVKDYMFGHQHWPAAVAPELLWMSVLLEVKHNLTSFAFKPELRANRIQEVEVRHDDAHEDEELAHGASAAEAANHPNEPPSSKRRSHHQRQRKKKYLASVQLPTPSSLD